MKRIPNTGYAIAVLTGLALIAIAYCWPSPPTVQQPEPVFEYDDAEDDCDCDVEQPEAEIPAAPVHHHPDGTITRPEWKDTALANIIRASKFFVHDRRFALFQRGAVPSNHAHTLMREAGSRNPVAKRSPASRGL